VSTNEQNFGFHGKVLIVNLADGSTSTETVDNEVYRKYLGGYGLGAHLIWKHYPAKADALAPEACFTIVAGLLTGTHAPFSSRSQICGKSPLTGTWADSNSGGAVASQLAQAGYDALLVHGKAKEPSVLVIRDDEVAVECAGDLWGQEIPQTFDALREKYGSKNEVSVSAIGPAGEKQSRIASVMNDRYHAFGRAGFGAVYGSKNLKAIVVAGSKKVPVAYPDRFEALCGDVNRQYKQSLGLFMRLMVWFTAPKRWLGWLYRLMAKLRMKVQAPIAAMRQLWTKRGTTAAVSMSIENGDCPVGNWKGVGSRDFPLSSRGHKLDGLQVDRYVTKRLSCGDCPMPCKGIVGVKKRGLSDVRRPDYETLCGFGANILNDDLETVIACHDACNRYGIDAVSSAATLGWVCEAVEKDLLSKDQLDGIDMRWGDGEAALALTVKMGRGDGCGAWLAQGVARAATHLGRGSDSFAVHVHGQEPAYHDPRFTPLMGVTYIADPTPGRHTAGSASWNESFGVGFPLPAGVPKTEQSVAWKGTANKGLVQAHFSNAYQVMNGLGICEFTLLTGSLPWKEMVNSLTGWQLTEADLLQCGERIQNLRAAFNWREGIKPADFKPHPRMMGEGDGNLDAGPLKGVKVPLLTLRDDYYRAMNWDPQTGHLSQTRADELGMGEVLQELDEEPSVTPAATND
jgi:aldehyde:ferredoxin oxidoreductase